MAGAPPLRSSDPCSSRRAGPHSAGPSPFPRRGERGCGHGAPSPVEGFKLRSGDHPGPLLADIALVLAPGWRLPGGAGPKAWPASQAPLPTSSGAAASDCKAVHAALPVVSTTSDPLSSLGPFSANHLFYPPDTSWGNALSPPAPSASSRVRVHPASSPGSLDFPLPSSRQSTTFHAAPTVFGVPNTAYEIENTSSAGTGPNCKMLKRDPERVSCFPEVTQHGHQTA